MKRIEFACIVDLLVETNGSFATKGHHSMLGAY
jgi:hypothetical protein